MGLFISPTQDDVFALLGDFIESVLDDTEVVQGQINRVSELPATDFVVMWALRFPRLATNIDTYVDAVFTGAISGTTLNITAVSPDYVGEITVGSTVYGNNVVNGTQVDGFGTGTGGVGTYVVNNTQTVSSEILATGTQQLLQKAECVMQLDVHGVQSSDDAQIISTTFRDAFAVDYFTAVNPDIIPLYCKDPVQTAFLNAENQYEDRFSIEMHLQVNQKIVIPQQFADALVVDVINVDAVYPPS